MTPNYRALCADLLWALENAISIIYGEDGTKHIDTANPIVERARAALAAEPVLPAEGEVAELVAWLHGQDGGIGKRAIYSRVADLLERLAPQPMPEELTDRELRDIWFEHSYGDEGFLVMTESMFLTASRIILDRLKLK